MEIADAVAKKRLIRFFYDGYCSEVEPHTYGIDKKDLSRWSRIR